MAAGSFIPGRRRVQAPSAPGFKPPWGSRPWRLRFRPQSGLVQRGVLYAAAGGYILIAPQERYHHPLNPLNLLNPLNPLNLLNPLNPGPPKAAPYVQ